MPNCTLFIRTLEFIEVKTCIRIDIQVPVSNPLTSQPPATAKVLNMKEWLLLNLGLNKGIHNTEVTYQISVGQVNKMQNFKGMCQTDSQFQRFSVRDPVVWGLIPTLKTEKMEDMADGFGVDIRKCLKFVTVYRLTVPLSHHRFLPRIPFWRFDLYIGSIVQFLL